MRCAYKMLVGKSEGIRPFGRSRLGVWIGFIWQGIGAGGGLL
jgi:hypothetical protein